MLLNAVFLLILFSASAFFSGTETALFSLSKMEKKRLQKRHPKLARIIQDHLEHPRRTLTTLLIGNVLVNTLASACATLIILEIWGPDSLGLGISVFTASLILFCEITPKILAAGRNETFSALASPLLRIFAVLFYPLIGILHWVTGHIMALMTMEKKLKIESLSGDELKTLVKIGEEEGVFDRKERRMMHKLFELGERPVKEIMTPRVDMIALDIEETGSVHHEMMAKYHFSHFPVYEGSPDKILGVISVQEYLLHPKPDLRKMLHQPLFVPETKRIDDLLTEFQKTKQIFAICVDEYGGTAGLATLEDILEEIFGEYHDEYEKAENPIRSFGNHEFIVDAKISLSEFNEFFGADLEAEESATLGGFIMEKLGKVPASGQLIELPEMTLRIKQVVRQRILSVIVRKRQ